jgi:hypothetical protein
MLEWQPYPFINDDIWHDSLYYVLPGLPKQIIQEFRGQYTYFPVNQYRLYAEFCHLVLTG